MSYKKAVKTEQPKQQQTTQFQQSAETVGTGIRNDLVANVATPMGLAMADAITAEALRVMGEALKKGQTGPLTQQMMQTLTTGITRPFETWKNEIETWYEPVALLPSSEESSLPSS